MVRTVSRPCRTRNIPSRNSSASPRSPAVTCCSKCHTSVVRAAMWSCMRPVRADTIAVESWYPDGHGSRAPSMRAATASVSTRMAAGLTAGLTGPCTVTT